MKLLVKKPDLYLHAGSFPNPQPVQHTFAGAPAFLHGVKAIFLSDLHLRDSTPEDKLRALTDRIAAAAPDLLLLGGDYAESSAAFDRFIRAFADIRCPLGKYAVLGNNDREFALGDDALRRKMHKAGIRLMINESVGLSINGGRLGVGGCDEYKRGNPRTKDLFSKKDGYRILLSHYPVAPECRADIMLSGHTHGGQFNFFGVTPYFIGFERRYSICGISGMHKVNGMQALVSNGIGISRIPLRIGTCPQIHTIFFVK